MARQTFSGAAGLLSPKCAKTMDSAPPHRPACLPRSLAIDSSHAGIPDPNSGSLAVLSRLSANHTAGWKVVKDSKETCQIAVPPEWVLLEDGSGAAVFQGPTTAIAVVTSQPGQFFKPLSESLQKVLEIRKEKVFENSVKRLFYQDKTSKSSSEPNGYSASVPGKAGTCSCHVTFLPSVSADTVKKIALSLGAVPQPDPPAEGDKLKADERQEACRFMKAFPSPP